MASLIPKNEKRKKNPDAIITIIQYPQYYIIGKSRLCRIYSSNRKRVY